MNLIDHILNSVHYHNKKHLRLTILSWNIQKIIGKLTGRYKYMKTELGLILEESIEYETKLQKGKAE